MSSDLLAFQLQDDGTLLQTPLVGDSSGVAATGVDLFLQRLIVELMTDKDSIPGLKGRGSIFLTRLRSKAATEADVFAAFAAAMISVKTNLAAEDKSTDPPEEKLQDAQLQQVKIKTGVVDLVIKAINQAGSSAVIVWPVTFRT